MLLRCRWKNWFLFTQKQIYTRKLAHCDFLWILSIRKWTGTRALCSLNLGVFNGFFFSYQNFSRFNWLSSWKGSDDLVSDSSWNIGENNIWNYLWTTATKRCMNGALRVRVSCPNIYDARKGQSKIEHEPFDGRHLGRHRGKQENFNESVRKNDLKAAWKKGDLQAASMPSVLLRIPLETISKASI